MKSNLLAINKGELKKCPQCSERDGELVLKPATADFFRRDPSSGDGFRSICKECESLNRKKVSAKKRVTKAKKASDEKAASVTVSSQVNSDERVDEKAVGGSDERVTTGRIVHVIKRITLGFGVFCLYVTFLTMSTFNGSFLFRHNFLTVTENKAVTEVLSHVFAFAFVGLSALLWFAVWEGAWRRMQREFWVYLVAAVIVQGTQVWLFQDSTRERLVYRDFKEAKLAVAADAMLIRERIERLQEDLAFHEGVVERYPVTDRLTARAWADRENSLRQAEKIRADITAAERELDVVLSRRIEVREPERTTVLGILLIPEIGLILCPVLLGFLRKEN